MGSEYGFNQGSFVCGCFWTFGSLDHSRILFCLLGTAEFKDSSVGLSLYLPNCDIRPFSSHQKPRGHLICFLFDDVKYGMQKTKGNILPKIINFNRGIYWDKPYLISFS